MPDPLPVRPAPYAGGWSAIATSRQAASRTPMSYAMNWVGLVDVRVPMALLFLVNAASQVEFARIAAAHVLLAVLLVLFAVRVFATGHQWVQFDRLIEGHLRAFEALAPESTLFTARRARPHSWAAGCTSIAWLTRRMSVPWPASGARS
jgi:hypothetical protein